MRGPLETPDEGTAPGRSPGEPAIDLKLPRRRVLIVDDTKASSFVLGKLLEKLGQDVHVASNASEGLAWAREARPDLIISDISMPEIDGYEFARRLRLDPALGDCLLVALTGYGQASDKERTREAGFDHHLVKPVSLDGLRELLGKSPRDPRHV